jgi:uncharacterized protein (DUF58 family)
MTPPAPSRKRGRTWRLMTGWILTIAGIILIPVPVLSGVVFLVPGIAILCAESRWIRNLLRRYRERRLLRRALREAERVGIKINLEHDSEIDGEPEDPPGSATGSRD